MPKYSTSDSVLRQLQLVFTLSTLLLVGSLGASYYSIQKLIDNSKLVNHTNQVLIEAENVISNMKDAETGQRGFLVTLDTSFLQPYNGAYEKTNRNYINLKELTSDNSVQQQMLDRVKELYEAKFDQMRRIINLAQRVPGYNENRDARNLDMTTGKKIMDDLRLVINQIKTAENKLLAERISDQQTYITYTPFLLVIVALISILITTFTYLRIKTDMDDRIAHQKETDQQYREANERIAVLEDVTQDIADGNYAIRSDDVRDDEIGRIGRALNVMTAALERTFTDLSENAWLQTGAMNIGNAIRGQRNLKKLANNVMDTLADYLKAPLGAMYLVDNGPNYRLTGRYAVSDAPEYVIAGEGLVGQAIERKKTVIVHDLPDDYQHIRSATGEVRPKALVIVPLLYGDDCVGVVELGLLREPQGRELAFLERNQEAMAIGVNAALDYVRLQNFLEETQAQSEELQAQQHELENLNAELEMQTQKLQASEEELRVQQEELQQTNTELEERGLLLEERNDEIQQKATELELSTRYKSEFLANMSHELRTPLNSILLLSRLLSENTDENLNEEEVEYAKVIQSSGKGLLGLIDEILDLSKIEAGQMTLDMQTVEVGDIASELQSLFGLLAKEKGLDFVISVADNVPKTIETDKMRLGQILKNLISNALKFTSEGSVKLKIERPADRANQLSFTVEDTGIGIAPEKQHLVFEAFQQADGSTKRKYGGTGLGLSISRELAKLLGGDIELVSEVGKGSQFTVYVPADGMSAPAPMVTKPVYVPEVPKVQPAKAAPAPSKYISTIIPEAIPDDRNDITEQDKTILIIEDDVNFAKSLLDYSRKKGYKVIVSVRGDEGLQLANTFKPKGILLDLQLPIMSGWEVMDALKANPQTRPIPVHMMSSHKVKNESMLKGAIDFVDKPMAFEQMHEVFKKIEYVLNRDAKKVLIIEDNPKHAKALAYFLETFNINSELKSNINDGVVALKNKEVDCVILDMGIPDNKAYETLEEAKKNPGLENLPIIIFTGRSLSMSEELKIKKYADSIIVKTAHSYQRMLDEVSLFLHLVEENKQSTETASPPKKLGALSQVLNNKTVLVADDDVRNIFSLSKALEQYNMNVVAALDGKEAMQKLTENPAIDLVLLDMMMPEMDGYETATKIRSNFQWRNLPVIAVTAKAMTGDREKCIQAGASDYITKPVDIDQLISLLRVWLYDRS
ncbi:response regulator [Spirosoma sp. KUDC1026]|uniref:response regulator n=1 Tax=Spirosoma sp. KUDC1026 TaxID=2745947 RepID=UPI00159BD6F6|nr:response regulator [Spirosoma sp. KUDC1026]QKZ13270.1 response regulator [Spirosoma sp. KUDC1026]